MEWLSATQQLMVDYPMASALILLMFLDIASGLLVAFVSQKLSSTVSRNGMAVKAGIVMCMGVATIMEPLAGGMPLQKTVALFFIVTEAISVIENLGRAGVPLPAVLTDALAKLKTQQSVQPVPEANDLEPTEGG